MAAAANPTALNVVPELHGLKCTHIYNSDYGIAVPMAYFNSYLGAQLSSYEPYREKYKKHLVLIALPKIWEVAIHGGENLRGIF